MKLLALTSIEWVGVVGTAASVLALLLAALDLARQLRRASPRTAAAEFLIVYRSRVHYLLTAVLLGSLLYIIAWPPSDSGRYVVLIPVVASLLLLASFFYRQNRRLLRNVILDDIRKTVERTRAESSGVCTAIKFDIDLLVAINDYSVAVGSSIYDLAQSAVADVSDRLKRKKQRVSLVNLPESDETIMILPGVQLESAADIADEVRRAVKAGLKDVPHYQEAREHVIASLRDPPLNAEEQEGIGTVSAGVAAYSRGEEGLLSDISAAVKLSKFRGRNKTIIYRPRTDPIIRSDY